MASAARAYAQQQPLESPRPDLRVLPGKGRDYASNLGVSPFVMTCFKIAVVAILVLAAIGVARVWFTAATVSTLMDSENLTSQIDTARATGANLEVQQTVLANPTRIKAYATDNLGMVTTTAIEYMDMSDGAVATDSSGNLSLSGSLVALDDGSQQTMVADASASSAS